MFALDREHIFYLFQLIAETSRQLSLSNPDYVLEVVTYPVESLYLEALDLRTGNRARHSTKNHVFVMNEPLPVNRMAEHIAYDLYRELNYARTARK